MGEILFGHHTYGLTLPRIHSEKISVKIVVKQISKLILSLSFVGRFHATLHRFASNLVSVPYMGIPLWGKVILTARIGEMVLRGYRL